MKLSFVPFALAFAPTQRLVSLIGWCTAVFASVALTSAALAQDAVQGAMTYVRLANDTQSCLSCHGPDPGFNRNNILRAADNPGALVQVLNTVGVMGFLRSQLTEADRANITAFLGTMNIINAVDAPLRMWPVTLEFGTAPLGHFAARQVVRLLNPSSTLPLTLSAITSSNDAMRLVHTCLGSPLPPQGSCDIAVEFRPSVQGLQRAAIQINSPGISKPVVVGLSGYGSTVPVSLLDWQVSSTPVRLQAEALGPVVRQKLTLINPGTMPAVLALTSITGPQASQFRVESGCAQGSVLQAGTQCDITLSYTPGLVPQSNAVLQVRSDQGNPAALLLVGTASSPPKPAEPAQTVPANSGGGCSVGPPGGRGLDPLLWLMILAAAVGLWGRRAKTALRR